MTIIAAMFYDASILLFQACFKWRKCNINHVYINSWIPLIFS
jgi:hypothetical protein